MSGRTGNIIQIAVIIIGFIAAFLLTTNPAETAARPSECQRWAYNEGEDGFPDSIIMKTIGCDDGAVADGNYGRAEGRCAAIARAAYRSGNYAAASAALDRYMALRGCDTFDDGSYNDLRTNRP